MELSFEVKAITLPSADDFTSALQAALETAQNTAIENSYTVAEGQKLSVKSTASIAVGRRRRLNKGVDVEIDSEITLSIPYKEGEADVDTESTAAFDVLTDAITESTESGDFKDDLLATLQEAAEEDTDLKDAVNAIKIDETALVAAAKATAESDPEVVMVTDDTGQAQ